MIVRQTTITGMSQIDTISDQAKNDVSTLTWNILLRNVGKRAEETQASKHIMFHPQSCFSHAQMMRMTKGNRNVTMNATSAPQSMRLRTS